MMMNSQSPAGLYVDLGCIYLSIDMSKKWGFIDKILISNECTACPPPRSFVVGTQETLTSHVNVILMILVVLLFIFSVQIANYLIQRYKYFVRST